MSSGLETCTKLASAEVVQGSPRLRNLIWRSSRLAQTMARGEWPIEDMAKDGVLDLLRRALSTRDPSRPFVAFDVGAKFGDWIAAAASLLREGANIQALEPTPTMRAALVKRFAHAPQVLIEDRALSDAPGEMPMIVRSATEGTNSLVFDATEAMGDDEMVRVPVTTMDAYVAQSSVAFVDIVKCDEEGADPAILRGAAGLLAAGRIDLFQFEYNTAWISSRSYLRDVFDLVAGKDYALGRVMPGRVEVIENWHNELERYLHANYVLIRRLVLPRLKLVTGRIGHFNTFTAD